MIKAEKNTPTGCAHSIHIAIQRFYWRNKREITFINNTLQFHKNGMVHQLFMIYIIVI